MKIGNTEIIIKQVIPTKEALTNVYDVCNRIFKTEDVFYTSTQVKELKKDKRNIFL